MALHRCILRFNAASNSRNDNSFRRVSPTTTLGGDDSWWEPVIGARSKWELNEEWATVASVEFGGFGAGGNDLQVGLNVGFDYQPWDNTSILFGYRYFSMDYITTLASGPFGYDVEQHGPYIGVKYVFQ